MKLFYYSKQTSDSIQAQVIQNNQPQAMAAPVINPVNSPPQPQQIMQQNYQFASQPQVSLSDFIINPVIFFIY